MKTLYFGGPILTMSDPLYVQAVLVEGGNCRVFQFHSGTGEGIMTQYDLFPGVSLMYNDFHMESYDSAFRTTEDLLCIDYCRQGRMDGDLTDLRREHLLLHNLILLFHGFSSSNHIQPAAAL